MNINTYLKQALADEAIVVNDLESTVTLEEIEIKNDLWDNRVVCNEIEDALSMTDSAMASMESLQTTYGEAGVTQDNLTLLAISTEVIMAPFQCEDSPAMESVDTAMEGIADKVKQLWTAMIALIKKAIDTVMDIFKNNAIMLKRLGKAAEKLGALAKKADGSPKLKTLKTNRPEYLLVDNKLVGTSKKTLSLVSDNVALSAEMKQYDKAALFKLGNVEYSEALDSVDKVRRKVKDMTAIRFNGGGYYTDSKPDDLPGGGIIAYTLPRVGIPITHFLMPVSDGKSKDIDALTASEIVETCDSVVKLTQAVVDLKKGMIAMRLTVYQIIDVASVVQVIETVRMNPRLGALIKDIIRTTANNLYKPRRDQIRYGSTIARVAYQHAKLSYTNLA